MDEENPQYDKKIDRRATKSILEYNKNIRHFLDIHKVTTSWLLSSSSQLILAAPSCPVVPTLCELTPHSPAELVVAPRQR